MTLKDLGERLQLSPFTVSRALAGKGGMSEETRAAVLRTASELGYRWKDRRAEPPRRTLAIAAPARFLGEFSYFADLIQGAEAAAREAGAGLEVVGVGGEDEAGGFVPDSIRRAAGAIYLPMIAESWLLRAIAEGSPAVVVNFAHRAWPVDSVVWDAEAGVGLCVDHLVARGHRRVGYVGSPDVAPGYRLRWVGFQQAIREHGLELREEDRIFPVAWPPGACLTAVRQSLAHRRDGLPTAFVCDFETAAVATLRALQDLGVPTEIACADQLTATVLLSAPMAHVIYHRDHVGRRAVERLLRRIERPDEPHEHLRVAVALREPPAQGNRYANGGEAAPVTHPAHPGAARA